MKKLAITLSTAMLLSTLSTYASTNVPVVPVGCPTKSPCQQEQPCNPCETDGYPAPVFNSCTELQEWKTKFFAKRCDIYSKLGLSQEQRIQAKTIDERFFDDIAPLKICCKTEKEKLKQLECQKCSWSAKREQKEKIKDLKAEIKDKKKQHKECFEKILNDCQKKQYKKLTKNKGCDC